MSSTQLGALTPYQDVVFAVVDGARPHDELSDEQIEHAESLIAPLVPDMQESALATRVARISAYTLAFWLASEVDEDDAPPAVIDLIKGGPAFDAIGADDRNQRAEAGFELRRLLVGADQFMPDWLTGAETVARWLTATGREQAVLGGHLARWATRTLPGYAPSGDVRRWLQAGWWAVHASPLARQLASTVDLGGPGRPPADEHQVRAVLALATARWQQTRGTQKKQIAGDIGITRATLDAWINRHPLERQPNPTI